MDIILIVIGIAIIVICAVIGWEVSNLTKCIKERPVIDPHEEASAIWHSKEVQEALSSSIHEVFESETEKLAKMYASEKQAIAELEELIAKDEPIDLEGLTDGTQKMAWALVLQRAHKSVALAESDLLSVQEQISETQAELDSSIAHQCITKAVDEKEALSCLLQQQEQCQERAQIARQALDALVAQAK